jgi:hypothetical protein
LRRSPQSLEADLKHPRGGVLDLRSVRSGTGPRRRLDGRSRRVGGFRCGRRDRRLSYVGFGVCRTGPRHVVMDSSTRWAPNCWWRSGPKGGRRHNSPLNSLPPSLTITRLLLPLGHGKEMRKYLTAQKMKQGNTQ